LATIGVGGYIRTNRQKQAVKRCGPWERKKLGHEEGGEKSFSSRFLEGAVHLGGNLLQKLYSLVERPEPGAFEGIYEKGHRLAMGLTSGSATGGGETSLSSYQTWECGRTGEGARLRSSDLCLGGEHMSPHNNLFKREEVGKLEITPIPAQEKPAYPTSNSR